MASKEDARRPHSVKVLDFGRVTCDKCCIWWAGHNICSHTVAVAEKTKMLAKCLQWLRNWTKTGTQTKGGAPNSSSQENKATQRRKGRSNTTVTAPPPRFPRHSRVSHSDQLRIGIQQNTTVPPSLLVQLNKIPFHVPSQSLPLSFLHIQMALRPPHKD